MRTLIGQFFPSLLVATVVAVTSCVALAVAHFMAARDPQMNAVTRFIDRYLFQPRLNALPLDRRVQMRIVAMVFAFLAGFLLVMSLLEVKS